MTENKNPGNDPSAEFERQRKRKGAALRGDPRMYIPRRDGLYSGCARQAPRRSCGDQYVGSGRQGASHRRRQTQKAAEQLRSEAAAAETHDDTRRQFVLAAGRRAPNPPRTRTGGRPPHCGLPRPTGPCSGRCRALRRSAAQCRVEALKEQVAALQSQLDAERQQPDPLELAEGSTSSHGSISAAERPR